MSGAQHQPWREDDAPSFSLGTHGVDDGASSPVVVESFGQSVQRLSSIRQPCRLTVHGSDEVARSVLVKTGEDLRLDNRVEQVLGIVNDAVRWSGTASTDGLALELFGVQPLTPKTGLIEWVSGSKTLRECATHGKQRQQQDGRAYGVLQEWINQYRGSGLAQQYHHAYCTADDEEARALFRSVARILERGAIRDAIVASSPTADALITSRTRFGASLAAVCASGWLLGIGDRHPDNLLVLSHRWTMMPIDFGYSFGFGTSGLPVPELIPFRLTPSLLDATSPVDGKALVCLRMGEVFGPLRQEPWIDVLAEAMDVFVREPTVDWRLPAAGGARMQARRRLASKAAPAAPSRTAPQKPPSKRRAAASAGGVPATSTLAFPSEQTGVSEITSASTEGEERAGNDSDEDLAAQLEMAMAPLDDSKAKGKIAIVRRKLDLDDPEAIMETELRSNQHVKASRLLLDATVRVVRQAALQDPLPGTPSQMNLHLHKLVSIATDSNVLGRQYCGLRTYM